MEEIEYRGPLHKNQAAVLSEYLTNSGSLIKQEFEKLIFFETANIKAIGDFNSGSARLSLKSDNKGTHLRLKEGNPSAINRKEFAVKIEENDIPNLIYILNRLGLNSGYYRPTFRQDFAIGNLIVSIKTKCVMGDHFELELSDPDINSETAIEDLMLKFNLSLWTKDEYKERIAALMIENPALNILESKIFEK